MFCLLVVVVVSKAAREKLKYALHVLFCIAPPSHCVHGQILIDKSLIRNFWSTAGGCGGAAPRSHQQNCIPRPNCFFFLRGFRLHKQKWSCSSCSCFVGTQERVLRPLGHQHSGPKHVFSACEWAKTKINQKS